MKDRCVVKASFDPCSHVHYFPQIELLGVILPYVEYRESKAAYDVAKIQHKEKNRAYKQIEALNRPIKELQEYVNHIILSLA